MTVNGDAEVGDLALPAAVRLDVTVLNPQDQPVENARIIEVARPQVISGFGTLLGLPVVAGGATLPPQSTGANDTTPGWVLWPSTTPKLGITPPADDPTLLPITTPTLNVTNPADLLVAYQTNGSASLIIGVSDRYETPARTALDVAAPGVLGNDHSSDGATLEAVLETGVSHGSLQLSSDGSFHYLPDDDFIGLDTFTYRATASGHQSRPIEVTIAVEDRTPPEVTGTPNRAATNGWYNAPVIVTCVNGQSVLALAQVP